jgi:cytosine deaminase
MEHGVTCSLATNNVPNPFTPFGDRSLIRMANLYANIARLRRSQDITACFDMVTTQAAKLMNLRQYGVTVGGPADLVVLDCRDVMSAVCELSQPLFGLKGGRRTFTRGAAVLHRP